MNKVMSRREWSGRKKQLYSVRNAIVRQIDEAVRLLHENENPGAAGNTLAHLSDSANPLHQKVIELARELQKYESVEPAKSPTR